MDNINNENETDLIIKDNNKEENNKKELLDAKLKQILTSKDMYNPRLTKFLSKDTYLIFIQIINNLKDVNFINFMDYFKVINIPIKKILINGFIEFDFDLEQEKNILDILSKITDIYFNKDFVNFIYKKLSKIYRNPEKLQDLKYFKKFEKIFTVWKLLYKKSICSEKSNDSLINLYGKKKSNSNYLKLSFKNDLKKKYKFSIFITFEKSPILNINKFDDNFYFIKVSNDRSFITLKYNDIFNDKNPFSFSEVDMIIFYLTKFSYSIVINGIELPEEKVAFDFDTVSSIDLLNNFYGQISLITIIINNPNNPGNLYSIEIKGKNSSDKPEINKKEKKGEDPIECTGDFLTDNSVFSHNKIYKYGKNKLKEIEYFGGFESFIPLFKIIKYCIINLEEKKDFNKDEKEDNNNYINKILKYVKDILKTMLKLICFSENNYKRFKNIVAPLIGSLAEINQSLDDLVNSNLIEENIKPDFCQDEIIYSFYIILINLEVPFNMKNAYKNLFEIKNDWDMNNFSMDYILMDIEKKETLVNIDWYFSILFNFIIFCLFYFESVEKIPRILIEKLNKIQLYMSEDDKKYENVFFLKEGNPIMILINEFNLGKNDDIMDKLNNLFINGKYYFRNIISLIKIYMNVEMISKKIGINKDKNYIKKIFLELKEKNDFKKMINKKKEEIKDTFIFYRNQIDFLRELFPFLNDNFESKEELLINEIVDYHKFYHHLMKELFVFNRLWSKKKLFYTDSMDKRNQSNLKYKNINYYTINFQRPIIYPVLDYKNRYPEFTKYNFKSPLFYINDTDIYNFDLDCPILDKIIDEYDKKIYEKIEKEENIKIFKICLVKQKYHVKGTLFVFNSKDKLIIYFYSHSYDLKNKNEKLSVCNKSQQNDKNELCYGSVFKCQKKEEKRKIIISIKDIRLIIKRIYYFRKSGLEIFTNTKSYYFNFHSEEDLNNFFFIIEQNVKQKKSYFPININNNCLGYMRINYQYIPIIPQISLKEINFIEFLSLFSKEEICNFCVFDIIILINLISNRSYIDLTQYPVFPLLFFYQQSTEIKRNIKEHIGFQNEPDESKKRLEAFEKNYKSNLEENEDNNINEIVPFFNTHYSNIVYICNYMIRLFPYSFLSIELQGNGFDDPNRLFFSIETTFNNISRQKSDLRELIPEFFYLPEMFINLNHIYFQENANKKLVNDVIMPIKLSNQDNYNSINTFEKDGFNISVNQNTNIKELYFYFVNYMKKELENLNNNFGSWLNIIFGKEQKYKNIGKNKEKQIVQLFREESYIDIDKATLEKYANDEIIMRSIDFGLIPINTIPDPKILNNFYKDENIQQKLNGENQNQLDKVKDLIKHLNLNKIIKKKDNKKNNEKKTMNFLKLNELFCYENIDFNKVNKDDNLGKLEIYIDNNIVSEIYDHENKIIDVHYNNRLNMFATTSNDGLACIYIFPNKLISVIKNPNNKYFDKIFLSANPFPTVITFEKENNILRSYSLSGLLIKIINVAGKNIRIKISPKLNLLGGDKIDSIRVDYQSSGLYKIYNLPFFDEYNDTK